MLDTSACWAALRVPAAGAAGSVRARGMMAQERTATGTSLGDDSSWTVFVNAAVCRMGSGLADVLRPGNGAASAGLGWLATLPGFTGRFMREILRSRPREDKPSSFFVSTHHLPRDKHFLCDTWREPLLSGSVGHGKSTEIPPLFHNESARWAPRVQVGGLRRPLGIGGWSSLVTGTTNRPATNQPADEVAASRRLPRLTRRLGRPEPRANPSFRTASADRSRPCRGRS